MEDCCFSTPVQQHKAYQNSAKKIADPLSRKRLVYQPSKPHELESKVNSHFNDPAAHAALKISATFPFSMKRRKYENRQLDNPLCTIPSDEECSISKLECNEELMNSVETCIPVKRALHHHECVSLTTICPKNSLLQINTDHVNFSHEQRNQITLQSCTPKKNANLAWDIDSHCYSDVSLDLSSEHMVSPPSQDENWAYTSSDMLGLSCPGTPRPIDDDATFCATPKREDHKSAISKNVNIEEHCGTPVLRHNIKMVHRSTHKNSNNEFPSPLRTLSSQDLAHDMPLLASESSSISPVAFCHNGDNDFLSSPPHTPTHESCHGDFKQYLTSPNAPLRQRRSRQSILHGLLFDDPSIVRAALNIDDDPNAEIFIPDTLILNYPDRRCLPLLAAAANLQYDIVKILLEHGSFINSVNSRNQTAAHLVCDVKYHQYRCQHHSETLCGSNSRELWYDFSLYLALNNDSYTDSSTMVTSGNDHMHSSLNTLKKCGHEEDHSFLEENFETPIPQPKRNQHLNHSRVGLPFQVPAEIEESIVKMMELLLRFGIDCSIRDDYGRVALDYAHSGQLNQVENLIKQHLINRGPNARYIDLYPPEITPTNRVCSTRKLPPFPVNQADNKTCVLTPFNKHSRQRFPLNKIVTASSVKKSRASELVTSRVEVPS